jgi:hypothetical protein
MLKRLYLRIRYRKQLKQGFGLLHDHGKHEELTRLVELVSKPAPERKDV